MLLLLVLPPIKKLFLGRCCDRVPKINHSKLTHIKWAFAASYSSSRKKISHTTGTKFLPKIALCNLNCRDDSRTPPSNSAELLLLRSHLRSRHFLFYIPPLLLLLFPPHDQRGGGCGKVNRQIRLSKQRRRRRMAAMMSSNNSREGHTLILNYCRGDRFCGFSGGERHTHAWPRPGWRSGYL